MLLPFLILVGVCIVTQVSANEELCKNHFARNQKQLFHFIGVVENGIAGTTNNLTKMKIEADVIISNWNKCKFYLQLSKVVFYQSFGEVDKFEILPAFDLSNRLTKHPLLFYMSDGTVTKIQPSVESTQPDVLNIQRGILSMLQVKQVIKDEVSIVNDVSGNCKTTYSLIKDMKFNEDVLHINKVKDLQTCIDHEITHSNIIGNPYSFSAGAKSFSEKSFEELKQSSILESNSHCLYALNVKNQAEIKDVHCEETFLVKAFSSESKAGAYVKSRSSLLWVSQKKIFLWEDIYTNFYVASIKYDHNHQHNPFKVPSTVKVSTLLEELSKRHYSESNFDTAEKFFDFVASLRQLNPTNIAFILQSVQMDKPSFRNFLLDGLAQCGTHECLSILFGAIQQNVQLQKEAHRFMPYIAFIKEPSPEIIRLLMGIHQQTKNPSMLLALSTLVFKLCVHRAGECNTSGDIGKVVEDVEYYLLRLLGNNCQVTNNAALNDIYFALKGIGNIGRSIKAVPLIMDCIRNAKHSNVSVAAIQSLRKMKIPNNVVESLREIFADKNEDFEKRAEILMQLMKNPSRDDIILARDLANHQEESGQMKSLIVSLLKSSASNQDPTKRKLTLLFKQTLEQYPLIDFDPSAYQYSKVFQKSANIFQSSAAIDSMILYHPESFIPRALRLNITTHMLGFSVNALEINARLEGLEMLLEKYFGEMSYSSDSYLGKVFKLPDVELKQRKRRGSVEQSYFEEMDNLVNMKKPEPHASVNIKIFGNDIHTLNDDDMPFLNGQLDNLNIVKELYELTKGKQNTFKQNMILLEASHSVPTILGLPLKIGINGSSVVTLDLRVKVSTKNILFGVKSAALQVFLNPSVSTHVSAKLNVECFGVGEIGTSFKMNLHAAKKISANADYVEGKSLKVDLDAEKQINDLFNVSYNIFHVLTGKEEIMKGVEKRSSIDICLDDIVSSSQLFGSDSCATFSFPNGYYNQSMPYFPLTGPFQLGVRNYPKDLLLEKYRFNFMKHDDLYDLTISTPGTSIDRTYVMSLGLKSESDYGVVALSYGEKRKGIILNYKFNNITNELETIINCNITNTPFTLFMQYYNQSDQSTLNKVIGEIINFYIGDYYMKHSAFYKSNYDFWAIGTKTEYSPSNVISIDFKIQYNPQVLTLVLSHPTTNSHFSGYFSPSLPYLVGEINITHGSNIKVKGSGKIDIANYKVEGSVHAQPFNQHVAAIGVWIPGDKVITLDAKVNENPISWKANLATIDNINFISSLMNISKVALKNNLSWNSTIFNSDMFVADKRLFKVATNIEKYFDGINISVDAFIKNSFAKVNLKLKNSSSLQELCIDGVFLNKNFGYCLSSHTEEFSKSININALSRVGTWTDVVSFNHSRSESSSSSSSTTLMSLFNHAHVSMNKSKQRLECSASLFGLHLSISKSLTDLHEHASAAISYVNPENLKTVYNTKCIYQKTSNLDLKNIFVLSIQAGHSNYNISYELEKNTTSLSFQLFKDAIFKQIEVSDQKTKSSDAIVQSYDAVTFLWENEKLKNIELKMLPHGILSFEVSLKDNFVKIKPNESSSFQPLAFFRIQPDNFLHFKLMKENYLIDKILSQYDDDMENVNILLSSIFEEIALNVVNKLKFKQKKAEIVDSLKNTALTYLTSLECNGEDVHKKYIKDVLTQDVLADFILKLLYIPNSSEATDFVKVDQLTTISNKTVNNLFSGMQSLLKGIITSSTNTSYSSLKNLNSLDAEFASFIENVVDVIQSSFNSEFASPDVQQKLLQLTKHFSPEMKTKFSVVIQNIVHLLKSWKYQPEKTLGDNLRKFSEQLHQTKIFELVMLDYDQLIFNVMLTQSKLPDEISNILKTFLGDSDYVKFASSVLKYVLKEFDVTGNIESHLNQLLDSQDLNEFLYNFCSIVVSKGSLNESNRFIFLEYLKSRNNSILLEKFKNALSKYAIPKDLLDIVFNYVQKNQQLDQYKDILSLVTAPYSPKIILQMIDQLNSTLVVELLSFVLKNESEYLHNVSFIFSSGFSLTQKLQKVSKMVLIKNKHALKDEQSILKVNELIMELLLEEPDIPNKIKLMSLLYHKRLKAFLKETVSSSWNSRLTDFINKVENHLNDIQVQKLSKNATLEILKVVAHVHQELSLFVENKLFSYLYEDLNIILKDFLSKVMFDDETGSKKLTSFMSNVNEKLLFLIRLIGQFSETETNPFVQNFVKKNEIDYYKLYQSLWEGNVASKENFVYINKLLNRLEQYLLDEAFKFTVNYSLTSTIDNIVFNIQSVNHSDINIFIDSFKQINMNQLKNFTYSAMVSYISMLLQEVGEIEFGDKRIDLIIYDYLPRLIQYFKITSDIWQSSLLVYLKQIEAGKQKVHTGFQYLKGGLKNQKHNKYMRFMIELLVPGIDGLFSLIKDYNPEIWHIIQNQDPVCSKILKKLIVENNNTIPQFHVVSDKTVNGWIKPNSSDCEIVQVFGVIIRLKKDENFLDNLINHVENVVLKSFDEAKAEASNALKVGDIMFAPTWLANLKSKSILHNITLMSTSHLVSSLKSLKVLQLYPQSLENLDFFTSQLQHLGLRISSGRLEDFLREKIPFTIKSTKSYIMNTTVLIFKTLDEIKTPFAKQPFVANPLSYMKNLPKVTFKELSKNVKKHSAENIQYLHKLEGKLRKTHSMIANIMAKQNGISEEVIRSLKNSLNKLINDFSNLSQYNILLEKELNSLNEKNFLNKKIRDNFKQRLEKLSNMTRNLKNQKFIQKQFAHGTKNNITINQEYPFLTNLKGKLSDVDKDLQIMRKSFEYLLMDTQQFTNQLIYPQIVYIARNLDDNICQFKRNISQFFIQSNDSYSLIWQLPGVYSQLMATCAIYKEYEKSKILNLIPERIENINKEFLNFKTLQMFVESQLEPMIKNYIDKSGIIIKRQTEAILYYYDVIYPYINQRPELIVQETLSTYQRQLMRIALSVNKAIVIKPLSQLETFSIKFIGVALGKKKGAVFVPLSRTAYLFTKSLITFDGKAIFFPPDFHHKNCIYLLARDFLWKHFSIYMKGNTFIVEFNDGSVQIQMNKKKKVHVYRTARTNDLPVQLKSTSVTRQPNLVKIENAFGLLIYCTLNVFSCNITISGYYHNKTLGLFGTNNVDYSDDLRMPNGKLALNLLEFLNAFEMSKKCLVTDPSQIFSNEAIRSRIEKEENCTNTFNQMSWDNNFMVKPAFLMTCSIEDICIVASSFMSRAKEESNSILSSPSVCEPCRKPSKKLRFNQLNQSAFSVHVTLLIKLVPEIERGLKKLEVLASRLQREFEHKYALQFSVIGFGGRALRKEPHIQTGNGEINMDALEVVKAFQNLQFNGEYNNERLGLNALKFASELEPESQTQVLSSKIFILFDDDATYSNSLLQMMEVHRSMAKRGIMLNVVNNYRLERDVIGRDSFGMRYLIRLPKGEKHSSIQFPPPDDYMPLVKQTHGAVFALKAFVSDSAALVKSWHITLSTVLQLQIDKDRKLCKECDCNFCKNVNDEECEFDL